MRNADGRLPTLRGFLRRKAFAPFQFLELAGRRSRCRVDELVAFRQLPLCEAARQHMLIELLRVHLLAGLEHDASERPFALFLVEDRDQRCSASRMPHQRTLVHDCECQETGSVHRYPLKWA